MTDVPAQPPAQPPAPQQPLWRGQDEAIPVALAIPASIGVLLLVLPLVALLIRTPWSRLSSILTDSTALSALKLSLICATSATVISIVAGVPLAWVLARSHGLVTRVLRALVILPLVLPPVVGGVALLMALGRRGVVGRFLDQWFGMTIPFTTPGVVIAETFVAMPFLVISVEGALRQANLGLEEAAATLGASRVGIVRQITLPLVMPSLIAGAVLCWARALGEFGATITFAGNLPGTTQTMPLAVYIALETNTDDAIALSMVLLLVCVAVLLLLRDRWLRPGARW